MDNFFETLYGDIYSLGNGYKLFFVSFFKKISSALYDALKRIVLLIYGLSLSYIKHLKRYFNAAKREYKLFCGEVKSALPNIKSKFKDKPSKGVIQFFHYVIKSFKKHEKFNRAVLSSVIPVFAVLFLISFYTAFTQLTFAVNVYVNNMCVGTLKDESAYKNAEESARKRFSATGSELSEIVPVYKIAFTTLNSIDDTETVCDNIISAVSDNTVYVCGVYIDGIYVCSVKSEDTFNRVTQKILNDYAVENGFDTSDYNVDFNGTVTTVSGYYPDNDKVLSAEEFYDFMTGYSKEPKEYVVKENDKLDDILKKCNISEEKLSELNPEIKTDYLPVGSVLLIEKGEKNVSVKAVKTYTKIETTDYESVMQYDNNLYIGTSMTIVAGIPGRDVVSYTDTYVDGQLVSKGNELSRYNANSPVNELVKIGTFGIPVGDDSIPVSPRLTRDQGGTFVWPAPDNCFWLSQGYNPYKSHYGIDIVSSDDGSSRGRRIVSVADGVVVMATYHYSWGYYVRVDHGDGVVTGYAHALQGSFKVNVGDYVKAGQQLSSIGTTGNSTGYHLHFEVWIDGVRVNPLPYVYSSYTGVAIK